MRNLQHLLLPIVPAIATLFSITSDRVTYTRRDDPVVRAGGSAHLRVFAVATLLVFSLASPAFGQSRIIAGGTIRILRPVISAAVENSSERVEDADPFVMSVVYLVRGNSERAGLSFVEGLINNDINDRETVDRIINSIAGVSLGSGIALMLAGADAIGEDIATFGVFVRANPYYTRWLDAVEAGATVRVVGGELAISYPEPERIAGADAAGITETGAPVYRETKENEVLPLLNVIHGRPGATILLDGEEFAVSTYDQYMFDGLPAGRRRITIIDGADAAEIMVFVNPGRVTETGFDEIELPLRRGVAWLSVDPNIPGLPVYVDDAFIGTTPIVDQPIPVGEHRVEIRSEWGDPVGWDVEGDVADRIEISESLDLRGAVRLSALVPETSEFQIDGQVVDTSYDPIYLEPGSYEVSLSDPLFDDYRRTVVVEAARATRVGADVEFRTGSVILDPMPIGANILVDGVAVGSGDAAGIILDALVIGEYTISIVSGRNREDLGSISMSEGDRIVLPVPTGTLTVTNVPERVVPIVDDAPLEIAQRDGGTVYSRPMLAGTYTVRLDDERYRPEEHEATIVAGETTAVRLVAFAQIARRNRPDDWEPWTRESRSRPGRLPIMSWGLGLELFSDPTTGDTYGPGLPPLFVGFDFAGGWYSEVSFGILQVRRDYDFEGDFGAYFRSVGEVEALYGLRYVFTWTNGYRFSDQSQTFDVIPALRLSMQTWELEFAVGDQMITWDVNNAGGVSPYTTTSAIGVGIGTAFRLHLGRLTLRLRFYADRNFLQDQLVREGDEVQPDGNQGFPTTALQTTPTGGFVFGGGIDLSIATGGRIYEPPAGP